MAAHRNVGRLAGAPKSFCDAVGYHPYLHRKRRDEATGEAESSELISLAPRNADRCNARRVRFKAKTALED